MNERFTKGYETIKKYVTKEEAARMLEADALAEIASWTQLCRGIIDP